MWHWHCIMASVLWWCQHLAQCTTESEEVVVVLTRTTPSASVPLYWLKLLMAVPLYCVCARGVIHLSEQWFSAAIESLFNSCLTLADLSIDYKQFSFHIICILSVFKCLLYMCRCVGVFQIPVSTGNNKNLCYFKTLTWLLTVWTLRI